MNEKRKKVLDDFSNCSGCFENKEIKQFSAGTVFMCKAYRCINGGEPKQIMLNNEEADYLGFIK